MYPTFHENSNTCTFSVYQSGIYSPGMLCVMQATVLANHEDGVVYTIM